MRWTERQQAQLREMGLRLWLPAADATATAQPDADPAPDVATKAVASDTPPATTHAGPPAAATVTDGSPVATLDWPALREAVAGCRACSLCESRRHTVFGVGHPQAHCMVVGEAPGEQEDLRGEPFVGPAGRLLDRMLAALGLTRDEAPPERQVFIANTLKCRPPHNRNPTPQELATCQPFLERQVALVQPRVILAMGRFAVQSLLGSDAPIGRLRGQVHHWRGVPLVVTYHPAYLLRQSADKARAWDDLCLAAQCLEAAPAGTGRRADA
jgi:DNA polymerase